MVARRTVLASIAALVLTIGPVLGQSYPSRPIRMIVPYPPGGPIDTMGRMVANEMSNRLGQQVIVDNRAGAGSTLATKAAAAAEPDGYTVLFGSSGSLAVAPALYQNLDIDPLKAFVPVTRVALLPHVFVVSNALPVKTVKEFVDYAKAHPGQLNYGAGLGTPPHLLSTLLVSKAGIDAVYVPYKGAAPAVTDLLAGRVQFTIDALITLYPLIHDGKLRALAIARGERWPELPDVPTLVESGFTDFTIDAWTGVAVPAGTPPQIVATLNRAINAGLETPDSKTTLAKFNAIPAGGSPEDFAKFLASEIPRWAALVKLAGAKAD
ncbi:MAG TPA: tripartite tricarboxylate transporter substrate binding protein [Xanthobacteraceae bacterium]|nr:tripartite tricarboxylate transporter substrate binding protein [Xanthobacteraceae bacterium]